MTLIPMIDEGACATHGDCVDVAPGVFELEDVAVVVGDGPADTVLVAARACPSSAISVIDSESGRQIYP